MSCTDHFILKFIVVDLKTRYSEDFTLCFEVPDLGCSGNQYSTSCIQCGPPAVVTLTLALASGFSPKPALYKQMSV